MLIKCPSCGSCNSLDSLIDDDPVAQALLSVLKITPAGRQVVKYLGLFRPEKRQLSWSRVATLLGELMPMIEAQAIKRNGVVCEVPHRVWESAIEKVIEARDAGRLQTPLKSHGYLLEVVITEGKRFSDENVQRADAKKQAERAANDQRMEDLKKSQLDAKAEAKPRPREKAAMPDNIKAQFAAALNGAKKDAALLTPEQLEAKKLADIARLKSMLTPEQRQQCEQRNQEHASA